MLPTHVKKQSTCGKKMPFSKESSAETLYSLLRRGEALTQEEAARRLGLSKRQVRRLLKELRDEGVEVKERWREGQKEYHLGAEDQVLAEAPVPLSERQMLALVVAVEAARGALGSTPLKRPLEEARELIVEHLVPGLIYREAKEEPAQWDFREAPSVALDPEVFAVLKRAIRARRSVRIDYHTASTGRFWEGRKIDPLLLSMRGGSWLVVAYCHEREAVRDFSLPGIEQARLCDAAEEKAYFEPPEDFDPELHFKGCFTALSGEESYEVRLLVEPGEAAYFRRKEYHPTQLIEEERPDGRLLVSYDVDGLDEMAAFVRSWGPKVKVLAPEELAERVAEDFRQAAARYEND